MMTKFLVFAFLGLGSVQAFAQANYVLNCQNTLVKDPKAAALVSASAAANSSRRIISDIQETRSTTDSETLPSFLIAQYRGNGSEVYILVDDGSPAGTILAELDVKAMKKKKGDTAIARYRGTYKRFDSGRQLSAKVDCALTQ